MKNIIYKENVYKYRQEATYPYFINKTGDTLTPSEVLELLSSGEATFAKEVLCIEGNGEQWYYNSDDRYVTAKNLSSWYADEVLEALLKGEFKLTTMFVEE